MDAARLVVEEVPSIVIVVNAKASLQNGRNNIPSGGICDQLGGTVARNNEIYAASQMIRHKREFIGAGH